MLSRLTSGIENAQEGLVAAAAFQDCDDLAGLRSAIALVGGCGSGHAEEDHESNSEEESGGHFPQ